MDDRRADVVRLKPDVEWRDLDGQVVALDLETSDYLKTNASGTLLWTLVAAGATEDELSAELVSRFAIDVDRARADVSSFVSHLRALSLVEDTT